MKTKLEKIELRGFKSFRRKTEIPLTSGFIGFTGPNGAGKCLLGPSTVLLSDGRVVTIKELVENALENDPKKLEDGYYANLDGVKVFSLSKELKLEKKPVQYFIKRKAPKKLLKITASSGRELTLTPYHPLIGIKNGDVRSLKAGEIKKGEFIAVPRRFNIKNNKKVKLDVLSNFKLEDNIYVPYSPETISLIEKAIEQAGGKKKLAERLEIPRYSLSGIHRDKSILAYSLNKILDYLGLELEEKMGLVKEIRSKTPDKRRKIPWVISPDLAKFLGYMLSEGTTCSKNQVRFTNGNPEIIEDFRRTLKSLFGEEGKLYRYEYKKDIAILHSKPILIYLDRVFGLKVGTTAGAKKISNLLLQCNDEILRHLISALFDGDAYFTLDKRKGKRRCIIEYSSRSRDLAKKVQLILLRFGIQSRLKTKEVNEETYYRISVYDVENAQRFANIFPLTRLKNKKELRKFLETDMKSNTNVDLIPETNELIHQFCLSTPINIKKTKKFLPKLEAYVYNYCNPSRNGLQEVIQFLERAYDRMEEIFEINDRKGFVRLAVNRFPITQQSLADEVGCGQCTISRFVSGNTSSTIYLDELYKAMKDYVKEVLEKTNQILTRLKLLANSDIFWDQIEKVEEIKPKEKWVYDLCIEGTHNFVAENVIVHNSNLLDAVTFALGGMSRKDLRTDTMDQVIFVGKDGRPARKAKVKLYFDNSSKVFPVDDSQLEIGREVGKDGNSVYLLNGKRSTRTFILDVLSKVNVRADGYNIVLQGEVNDIIERNPKERREIIDEAAGIAHYEEKKQKALKELEKVEDKLKEAEIILKHQEEYLEKLKQEIEAVAKYERLKQKIEDLKISLLAIKLQKTKKEKEFVDQRVGELEKDKQTLNKSMKQVKKGISEFETKLESVNTQILKQGGEAGAKLNKEIEELKGKLARRENKKVSNQEEIKRLQRLINEVKDIKTRTMRRSKAVESILRLKDDMRGIYGTVSQLYTTDPKYSLALSVTAGVASQFLVVDSADTAVFCVKYLKRRKIGRATFLPLDKLKGKRLSHVPRIEGIEGLAVDLVEFERKFKPVFDYLFGRTVIVTDIEKAKKIGIGRFRMVTLDGDRVEKTGIISGGFMKKEAEVRLSVDAKRYQDQIEDLEQENITLNQEIDILRAELKKVTRSLNQSRKDLKELYILIDKYKAILSTKREKKEGIYDQLIECESKLNNLKIQRAKLETSISELQTEAKQYDKLELKYKGEPKFLREQIVTANLRLNELGPVNFKAKEDYQIEKKGYDALKEKVGRLRQEKGKILNTMERIEQNKKEVFMDTLTQISANFNQLFKRLSNGEGELVLADPEDIESGLLIKARPSGKRIRNIDAMSGGEKALTVLAFIFAIQQHKPAPFYILDEADAALDTENSKRFANLLQELSRDSQILLISHNKYMLPKADQVFGVTMNENGESNLVGVRLA